MRITAILAALIFTAAFLSAQVSVLDSESEGDGSSDGSEASELKEAEKKSALASEASIFTQQDARTLTLTVPAPRGMILDRHGEPLAQNKVGYHLALDLTQLGADTNHARIISWSRQKIDQANRLLKKDWQVTDQEILAYHRDRRWIPWIVSDIFDESLAKKFQPDLPEGLTLMPIYLRHYPEKSVAAHLIGYTGTLQRMPDGPINRDDPLFTSSQGKAGFELLFEDQLKGEPGVKRMLYDKSGELILEEWPTRPKAGGAVVTTIDLEWQKKAEEVLRQGCERGALVVIDVNSGEVLVMASRPTFDVNDFIPGISHEKFQALLDDPGRPLFPRAFQGEYPPASAFKPVVALAALNDGVVKPNTKIHCPYQIKIGNHYFRNHTKTVEGSIDVKRALARSTNPWFYQVGIKAGSDSFLSMARKLGFGSKTDLPLVGERAGLIPNDEYMKRTHGRRITDGDTANLSIGQGVMLATPLQVAQAMAGIANGGALPRLRLVRQVQDFHGRVVQAPSPEARNPLQLSEEAISAVRQGMEDVIHTSYGTGKRASLSFTTMAGKTGTAQWGPASKNQRLAWFSGFFPVDNPRYAFAVLYEGKPGETVSGGRMAAPMVQKFFNGIRSEVEKNTAPPARAMVIVEDEDQFSPEDPDAEGSETIQEDFVAPRAELVPEDDLPEPEGDIPELGEDDDEEEEISDAEPLQQEIPFAEPVEDDDIPEAILVEED